MIPHLDHLTGSNVESSKRAHHTLFVRVYSRLERKVKMYNTGESYEKKFYDKLLAVDTLKEKDYNLLQGRGVLDSYLNKYQAHNIPENQTLKQFDKSLKGKIKNIVSDKAYLFVVWETFLNANRRITKSTRDHHLASIKSFIEFISKILKENPAKFLIQNIQGLSCYILSLS